MLELSRYTGIGQFGRAWQYVLENDPHAPGSVDRALQNQMIRLCHETAPYLYGQHTSTEIETLREVPSDLADPLAQAIGACTSTEECVEGIARFTAALGEGLDWDLDTVVVGGTEEEIISRGSDWCSDVARVACILCQLARIPARIVSLFNTVDAYCGHVLIEAFREGAWGAVDSSTVAIYRHSDRRPATTWDLMNDQRLLEAHAREGAVYTKVNQFKAAGIVNYSFWDRQQYDYSMSGINDYYRSILEMADKGWPGGFRWLHGEDSY